ncbi:MAG: hypothetical protein AAF684_06550 [Pseudomonadota bacterium]
MAQTPKPANDAAPDEVRMAADLPNARIEITHRADPAEGEEVITMTLRAQPSLDAAVGLFGPAATAAMLSLGAPVTPRGDSDPFAIDPMRMWTDAWTQWMSVWTAPFAAFAAPTLCGPTGPRAPKKPS